MSIEEQLASQNYPSSFRKWFEREFGRLPQESRPEDEAVFKPWIAGYECCARQHPWEGMEHPAVVTIDAGSGTVVTTWPGPKQS